MPGREIDAPVEEREIKTSSHFSVSQSYCLGVDNILLRKVKLEDGPRSWCPNIDPEVTRDLHETFRKRRRSSVNLLKPVMISSRISKTPILSVTSLTTLAKSSSGTTVPPEARNGSMSTAATFLLSLKVR